MKLKGMADFRKELKNISNEKQTKVVNALNTSALDIQRRAIKFSPVNKKKGKGGGILKGGNEITVATKLDPVVLVYNDVGYAAYQEFGTGSLVNVPEGYEDVAKKYKGSGLRKVNMKPNPYMIPAIEITKPKLEERLKKIFSK